MKQTEAFFALTFARACLGTPFHHQGRKPGIGLDCIGLIVCTLRALGVPVSDITDYDRKPDGVRLCAALIAHGGTALPKDPSIWQAGDILVFRYDGQPQHVAFFDGSGHIIHAFAPAGKVVETSYGSYWARRLCTAYRLNLSY